MIFSIRVASILCWISAIGFGAFTLPAIRNLLTGRGIPIVFGFPAYGGGPFERHGLKTSVPLLAAFLLVCVLEGVAGWLLRGGHKSGAILALALLPFRVVFWWGFALPFGPIFAVARTILILIGWRSLHEQVAQAQRQSPRIGIQAVIRSGPAGSAGSRSSL